MRDIKISYSFTNDQVLEKWLAEKANDQTAQVIEMVHEEVLARLQPGFSSLLMKYTLPAEKTISGRNEEIEYEILPHYFLQTSEYNYYEMNIIMLENDVADNFQDWLARNGKLSRIEIEWLAK